MAMLNNQRVTCLTCSTKEVLIPILCLKIPGLKGCHLGDPTRGRQGAESFHPLPRLQKKKEIEVSHRSNQPLKSTTMCWNHLLPPNQFVRKWANHG